MALVTARMLPVPSHARPSTDEPLPRPLPAGPVRVTHVITDLDVGGAETMLVRLLTSLDRDRVDNAVISLTGRGPLAEHLAARGIPVTGLDVRRGRPNVAEIARLIRTVRRLRPHVLQTWLYHADLLGVVTAALARRPPLVWNVRCSQLNADDGPETIPSIVRALAAVSRRPAAVVCNSMAGRRVHERAGYRPRRWVLIPNGVDAQVFMPCEAARQAFRREIGVEPHTPLVGLVARLHPVKDHQTFLQAAELVARDLPAVRWVLIGRGVATTAALRAQIAGLALEGRVHLLDERQDLPRVMPAFDVAVSSSRTEGFPNTVIEAMACGVPCVVTDVGDSSAIVGATGLVVPPADPVALARAMHTMLTLPAVVRAERGLEARARAVREYSLAGVTEQYQALYHELARGAALEYPACAE